MPRMHPNASPENTSRRITLQTSFNVSSPTASARITSVDACDPELPPLEMISGTKRARTTARAISFSKNPIAVAVSISPRNRTTSHPARFFTMRAREICIYGSSSASDPPNSWNSRVAASSAISSTSSTVTIPMSTPAVSVTGSAERSSRLNTATADSCVSVALRVTKRRSIRSETRLSSATTRNSRMRMSSISTPASSTT